MRLTFFGLLLSALSFSACSQKQYFTFEPREKPRLSSLEASTRSSLTGRAKQSIQKTLSLNDIKAKPIEVSQRSLSPEFKADYPPAIISLPLPKASVEGQKLSREEKAFEDDRRPRGIFARLSLMLSGVFWAMAILFLLTGPGYLVLLAGAAVFSLLSFEKGGNNTLAWLSLSVVLAPLALYLVALIIFLASLNSI